MYIAIEGIKGTGKSTLVKALIPYLKVYCDSKQQSLAVLRPTKPIPKDHHLERHFATSQHNDDYLRALYAARSNYHAARTDWSTELIISDRSILTSLAVRWQNAVQSNISPTQHYEQVRGQEHVIAIPDIVIHLDAPNAVLLERYTKRARQYGQHEETMDSVINLKNSYAHLYEWLDSEQALLLMGKSISVHTYNTGTSSTHNICQEIIILIEQNSANIYGEFLLENPYSLTY